MADCLVAKVSKSVSDKNCPIWINHPEAMQWSWVLAIRVFRSTSWREEQNENAAK